jgi:single-stranded-DNA-specific exonuclease
MEARAHEIADRLRSASDVGVYCHIDADGITGGAIASEALSRAGIRHDVSFLKKLDDAAVQVVKREARPLAWFVDFGAGQLHLMEGLDAVITDHHVPTSRDVPVERRRDLVRFAEDEDRTLMLNPHLEGEGSDAVSGAGLAYAVAKALDPKNTDLAAVAIVGAVGDVQDQEFRRLRGFNRTILQDGIDAGVVRASTDLRLFGRETRPIHKMFEYSQDPWIPRLTGNGEACISFLLEIGIDLKVEETWRTWSELDAGEKRRIVSEIVTHMLGRGCGWREVERLVGEVYTLVQEPIGSPTRDAKEFGTLINACGRYEAAEIAYRVCRGDRGEALEAALRLLAGHREHLVSSLEWIEQVGLSRLDAIQYFHAEDKIRDTVVGIAAGIALQASGNRQMPILAFAFSADGVKVSARASRDLVARGLDLAEAMREASRKFGGEGGGHHGAAGATIPRGTEDAFARTVDALVKAQLASPYRNPENNPTRPAPPVDTS